MSRKWTVKAARISASAGREDQLHEDGDREPDEIAARPDNARDTIRNRNRIGRPRKKCTMFASTLTSGSTSAGNRTFLIRLPPAMSDPAASVSEVANQVHGRMPQNMKTA